MYPMVSPTSVLTETSTVPLNLRRMFTSYDEVTEDFLEKLFQANYNTLLAYILRASALSLPFRAPTLEFWNIMAHLFTRALTFIPPPSGTKSNFVDPPDQPRGTIALHSICLLLAICAIVIRLYTRKFISRELWLDDYCCALAYLLTLVFSALLMVGSTRGLGRHLWDVPATQVPSALKVSLLPLFLAY